MTVHIIATNDLKAADRQSYKISEYKQLVKVKCWIASQELSQESNTDDKISMNFIG